MSWFNWHSVPIQLYLTATNSGGRSQHLVLQDRPNCSALWPPPNLSREIDPLVLLEESAGNHSALAWRLDSKQRLRKKGQEFHPTTPMPALTTGRFGCPPQLLVDVDVGINCSVILSIISTCNAVVRLLGPTMRRTGLARMSGGSASEVLGLC